MSRLGVVVSVTTVLALLPSCAPRPAYRNTIPPSPRPAAPAIPLAPPPPDAVLPTPEAVKTPLPKEAVIVEQDLPLKPRPPAQSPSLASPDTRTSGGAPAIQSPGGPLPDDSSLLAKITPATPPQRVASLRLTEEGRKLLDAGDARKALSRLEKTIVIDATNAYGYYYLAKAHFVLGRHRESINFLDVAESRLKEEPFWLSEVYALRGENYRALGMMQRASEYYTEALRLNPGNRAAADAMSRPQDGAPSVSP